MATITQSIDVTLDISGNIQASALLGDTRLVALTTDGYVIMHEIDTNTQRRLFRTGSNIVVYPDGGFDPSSPSSIYTMGDIFVLVNDFKAHGFVYNFAQDYLLCLTREDKLLNHCKYPIALFRGGDGDPYMIYGTDWDRVDVANLATRQVVTADKSRIEVDAEKHHIDFDKDFDEAIKLLWPTEFDHFYGKLALSPSKTKFVSAGWYWGSYDDAAVFDIAEFVGNHRVTSCHLYSLVHEGRSVCWVDDDTIAVPYKPAHEDDDDQIQTFDEDWQIRLYRADRREKKAKEVVLPSEPVNLASTELVYQIDEARFCAFSKTIGLVVIARDGRVLLQDPTITPTSYDEAHGVFLSHEGKRIRVFAVK
ncbi:MAG: hypothetical protein FWD63_02810 [Propionibacteriaceae bacterium]|nr:hypothetical protein [Propionibacteriaceae bacterium]